MPRPRLSVPAYRLHRATNKAVITVYDPDGRRRDLYLPGRHGSEESRAAYARLCGELGPGGVLADGPDGVTVTELCVAFLKHAQVYYRHPDGTPTGEAREYGFVLKHFRAACGTMQLSEFRPKALKAYRDQLIADGYARTYINQRVGKIRRMFQWGVEEELVPEEVAGALTLVAGLAAGRSAARETAEVRPVDPDHYERTLPQLGPLARALVEVLRHSGCRPGEACRLTLAEVDRTSAVWVYTPKKHKNAWRGQARVIPLGPKARAAVEGYLAALAEHGLAVADADLVFCAKREKLRALAERRATRKTKWYPSHVRRAETAAAAPKGTRRVPTGGYTPKALDTAIERACARAGVPVWHPGQLRHLRLTEVRDRHGLDAAQAVGGHHRAETTQRYAKVTAGKAGEIAASEG